MGTTGRKAFDQLEPRGVQRHDHPAGRLGGLGAGSSARPVAHGRHCAVLALQRQVGNRAVQRLLDGDEPDELQRAGTTGVEPAASAGALVRQALSLPGAPADGHAVGQARRAGADVPPMRVVTGPVADAAARAVGGSMFTVGRTIVAQDGAYRPGSPTGERAILHELYHGYQQATGPVSGSSWGDGLAVSDPSDRFEREAEDFAERATTGR